MGISCENNGLDIAKTSTILYTEFIQLLSEKKKMEHADPDQHPLLWRHPVPSTKLASKLTEQGWTDGDQELGSQSWRSHALYDFEHVCYLSKLGALSL